ncbi:MAG: cystathionine beta-lyase [Defluviicoccus sp.]|nr:cystathionine beta-lyase [Defluviicoccus sp.]MDG4608582.1 cystathionine beta-lyase [Defluviicoccus sp.]
MTAKDTLLVQVGREPHANHGVVNPPVYRASTILYPSLADYEEADRTPFTGTRYGRRGTPTTFALEEAVARLEGGYRAVAVPSGLAAITLTLLAFLKAGDHLLMVDSVYGPTRRFCDTVLKSFEVETTYYDPLADVAPLIRPNTKLIFLESPGSLTFEVQDAAAITAVAKARGIVTAIDNTWSAGLFFSPFEHGIDVSIQAATKYIVGHSDVMMGVITANEATWLRVKRATALVGTAVSPDDCYLALRGLRTLSVRLARHQETALKVARWLQARAGVVHVRHPAFADCPGHAFWRRDFSGSNGLVSFVTEPASRDGVAALLDGMRLFGLGASWGGYESLIIPFDPQPVRTASSRWPYEGPCFRLHSGLEDADELIADLDDGLKRLQARG